jgi:hypothetical protein
VVDPHIFNVAPPVTILPGPDIVPFSTVKDVDATDITMHLLRMIADPLVMQLGTPPLTVNTQSMFIDLPPQYGFPAILLLQIDATVLFAPSADILLSKITQSVTPGRTPVFALPKQPNGQLNQLVIVAHEPLPVNEPAL